VFRRVRINPYYSDRNAPPTEFDSSEPHQALDEGASAMSRTAPRYGFGKFLLDVILTLITGGLWLIWIFVREIRGLRQ
jgi:hypothetical protein